jgi:hypothetical protein
MTSVKNMSQLGFTNLEEEIRLDDLPVHGKIPEWLSWISLEMDLPNLTWINNL